jgi:ribosome-associated protein
MKISGFRLADNELHFTATHAGGPGGQHVNKASTSVQLKFDIRASSLPDFCKQRLLRLQDSRISDQGVVTIKAQRFRSQQLNKRDAISRLEALITKASKVNDIRKATSPPVKARQSRLDQKKARAKTKSMRRVPRVEDT